MSSMSPDTTDEAAEVQRAIADGTRPRTETGEQSYAVFLFVGLLPWTFFANSLQSGAAAIVSNATIVKKVRLPLQLLPAASVLSALANFLLSMVVLFAVLLLAGMLDSRHAGSSEVAASGWAGLATVLALVVNQPPFLPDFSY